MNWQGLHSGKCGGPVKCTIFNYHVFQFSRDTASCVTEKNGLSESSVPQLHNILQETFDVIRHDWMGFATTTLVLVHMGILLSRSMDRRTI